MKSLTEQLRDKDAAIAQREEELKHQGKEIKELQLSVERERDLSSGGADAQQRLTYLKNVIYRYLKTGPEAVSERQSLVPVICTIMRFTDEEKRDVEKVMAAASAGFTTSITSLFGWGGGNP